MKKKEARKLVKGDKLVLVREGSYGAAFKAGSVAEFLCYLGDGDIGVTTTTWDASQLIKAKDIELYKQTRRQQLIAAGVPAEELAKVVEVELDVEATLPAGQTLSCAFVWSDSPQGGYYWYAWDARLNGKDVTIPEPLDADPELYCVVYDNDNRMCAINPCEDFMAGTLEECKETATRMTRDFPKGNYRVMRLTPA